MAATLALILFVLWSSSNSERLQTVLVEDSTRIAALRGQITWLDEVLTMSARVAAATADMTWQDRYDRHVPSLEQAIAEAKARSEPDVRAEVDATTRLANDALIVLETQAFELARQGRLAEATAVLDSPAYTENKRTYASGMDYLTAALEQSRQAEHWRVRGESDLHQLVAAVICGIVITVWIMLARTLWLWRERTQGSEARYRRLSEAAMEGVIIHQDTIIDANRAFADMMGLPVDAVIGRTVLGFVAAEEQPVVQAKLDGAGGDFFEVTFLRPDGEAVHAELRSRPLQLGGRRVCLTAVRDVSERKRAEAKIRQLAHFDSLTGLPNRVLFWDRMTHALVQARRESEQLAVLCIDLDRFKDVNDTLGHAAGDRLLAQATTRLSACLRLSDTLARLGGDEFAVILKDVGDGSGAAIYAQRAIEALSVPFDLDGHEAVVGCSIGIALSTPISFDDPETLLRSADLALYRAKSEGRGTFRFFAEEMNARLQARKAMERDLRTGLALGQFLLVYQPQVELRSGRMCGVEALLRWEHPERGTIMPLEFVPLAEETGLIVPLGHWILRAACAQAVRWPGLRMAINLSAAQFRQPGLDRLVADALTETGLEASRLEVEVTESILLEDTEATLRVLGHLKELGVRIAMDDFGTGYSSLSYLRRFPFDKIKIDGSFIRDMEHAEGANAIVRAVVDLGHSLGMITSAEGVEKLRQADILEGEGCDEVQGYCFGRPMPADQIDRLIGTQVRHAAGLRRMSRRA